jgi:hypothetical protein
MRRAARLLASRAAASLPPACALRGLLPNALPPHRLSSSAADSQHRGMTARLLALVAAAGAHALRGQAFCPWRCTRGCWS